MQLKTNQDLAYGISGLLTASVGYLILLFLPVYLEVVALSLSLSEQEVGRLASTDSAGIVVATILFASFVSKLNFRKVAFLGVLISVVGNLLSGVVDSFYLLCLVRLVCGVGEGLLVAVGISALGMTSSPNRWFGYYTAAVVIVQAIGLAAVPLIYQSSGLFFVFFAIAIFYMLPLLVLKKLPKDSNGYGSVVTESKPSYVSKKIFWLAIMGLLSFYIGIGAVWSYISFLATDSGLPLDTVSQSLSLSMFAGLLGALFFAWLNKKGKSSILLFVSFAAMSACLIAVLTNLTDLRYLVLLSIFSFFWSIVGARTFAIISDADHSGKYINIAQATVGIGYIIGPMIAAELVIDFKYLGVNMLGVIAFMCCFVLMLPLAKKGRE